MDRRQARCEHDFPKTGLYLRRLINANSYRAIQLPPKRIDGDIDRSTEEIEMPQPDNAIAIKLIISECLWLYRRSTVPLDAHQQPSGGM